MNSEGIPRFVRRFAIVTATVLVAAYAAVFVLLVVYQRDMLFVRGRHAEVPSALYHVRTVTERDGAHVAVWEAASAQAGAPVIVFFYGNAGTLSDFANVGAAFHDDGYCIVLASYRGYAGNSGSPSEAGVMDDARAILAALPKGHGPVVLWGQSLGSGVAARMASEERGAALILQSPYTAIVDVAARRFPIYPVRWVMKDTFDTASIVPKIKVPVLIMHGTADGVVPFDMGETLARSLGAKATFVAIPGGTHNLSGATVLPIAAAWLHAHAAVIQTAAARTGRRG